MKKATHTQQIILIILSLAIIGLVFSFGAKKVPSPNDDTDTPSMENAGSALWPSTEIRKETIDQSDSKRQVNASYPITGSESVNAYFKQFVDEQIKQFKDDTSWIDDPEIGASSESMLSLDIDYVFEPSNKAHNYIFTISSYTGGAHGLSTAKTFSFSSEGKLIQLADLFTNGLSGLSTISTYVKKELAKEELTNKEWIDEGAAPTADNYRSFVITNDGIRFIFDPYQVAAYAAGSKTVNVPVQAFKSIANKDYFTL